MKQLRMGLRGSKSLAVTALVLILSGLSFSGLAQASGTDDFASDTQSIESCKALLQFAPSGPLARAARDAEIAAKLESHSLIDFFAPDSSGESMATRHPLVAMNAAQRFLAMVYSKGSRVERSLQDGTSFVQVHSALSDGINEADNRRVIGHERMGEILVQHLEMQADGFKTGLKMLTAVGNPGSGKSESREVLRALSRNLSLLEESFKLYTFEFINLHDIPGMGEFFPANSEGKISPIADPQNKTPLALLPSVYKDAVLAQVTPTVVNAIKRNPDPKLNLSPFSRFIHDEIIKHYSNLDRAAGRGDPSPERLMQFLNRHVRIKRFVYGDPGSFPTINFQGKNVNLGALIMSPDMMMQAVVPNHHPLAHKYGQIVAADGGMVLAEEVLKNGPDFGNAMLDIIQARSYSIEGAAKVEYDVVFLGTTNTDDVIRLYEAAKSHKPPLLDRMTFVNMNWSIKPHEIMQILMYDIPNKLQMMPLGDSNAKPVPVRMGGNMQLVVQRPTSIRDPWLGPDGRYMIQVSDNHGTLGYEARPPVYVAPHALMLLSRVVALSRMRLDKETVAKVLASFGKDTTKVPAAPFFLNEIERLAMLEGRADITPARLNEFWRYSEFVNEGTFGISARDASEWFGLAVKMAERPGYGNTVTPLVIRQVLDDLIRGRSIGKDDGERSLISKIATAVSLQLTIPDLKHDLIRAMLASNGEELEQSYDMVVQELTSARTNSSGVPQYSSHTLAVLKAYKARHARDLDLPELTRTIAFNSTRNNGSTQVSNRNHELMDAVADHFVESNITREQARLSRVLARLQNENTAPASESDRMFDEHVLEYMQTQLGYTPSAVADAIRLVLSMPSVQENQ